VCEEGVVLVECVLEVVEGVEEGGVLVEFVLEVVEGVGEGGVLVEFVLEVVESVEEGRMTPGLNWIGVSAELSLTVRQLGQT